MIGGLGAPWDKAVFSSSARSLYRAGILLVASGIFHILVWLLLGGDWEGSVAWRKPILFGISTGATLLSVAWFFDKLRPANFDFDIALCRILSISLVLEVFLITLQQWRGQASHFNHNSTFNSFVEYSMTALIVIATLVLLHITWRAFSCLDAEPDIQLAIRAGMGFLMLSCLIGFSVLFHGQYQLSNGREPSIFGQAGVAKFPHGVAIHAIQLFPILCWLFRKLGLSPTRRLHMLRLSIAAMGGLLMFSLVQTLLGKPRFEMNFAGGSILLLTTLLLVPIAWTVLLAILSLVATAIAPNQ